MLRSRSRSTSRNERTRLLHRAFCTFNRTQPDPPRRGLPTPTGARTEPFGVAPVQGWTPAPGLPTGDDGSRDDPLLSRNLAIPPFEPDLEALRASAVGIVAAVGTKEEGTLA